MSKFITINAFGNDVKIKFEKTRYAVNNNIAIRCMSEIDGCEGYFEPWGMLTVNLDRLSTENFAFIDVNGPTIPDITKKLVDMGLIERTTIERQSGFVIYPLYHFTDEFMNEWCEEN